MSQIHSYRKMQPFLFLNNSSYIWKTMNNRSIFFVATIFLFIICTANAQSSFDWKKTGMGSWTNGVNRDPVGRLDLPGITVSSNGSYNCGEAAGDVTNDLVNSVQMTFSGVMGTGTFSMAVLDPTNSVSAPPSDDWTVCLGIWDVTNSGFTFESVDASFCYDTVPLGDLPEGALRLYQYIDAEWVQVTTAVDADNNRALVAGIDLCRCLRLPGDRFPSSLSCNRS